MKRRSRTFEALHSAISAWKDCEMFFFFCDCHHNHHQLTSIAATWIGTGSVASIKAATIFLSSAAEVRLRYLSVNRQIEPRNNCALKLIQWKPPCQPSAHCIVVFMFIKKTSGAQLRRSPQDKGGESKTGPWLDISTNFLYLDYWIILYFIINISSCLCYIFILYF